MSEKTYLYGCCADKACTEDTCMVLPGDKTCGDCLHFRHCAAFYARKATDNYCDFFPRRFALAIDTHQGDKA